jgi:hypothetical protein
MSRNGSGTYNLPQPAFVSGTVISSTAVNSDFNDIANALTASIANDGQTPILANLPMSNYRHTGVGNAVARSDYAAAGQVQDGAFTWCDTAGGTADALTLTPTPAIAAYQTGQRFQFKASSSANTGATTVAVSGLVAKAVQLNDAALIAGDIAANKYYEILYDGTQFQLSAWAGAGATTYAANTFIANATTGTAAPTGVALSASQLAGRGASGNIASISLGTGLSMSGTTLLATGGNYFGTGADGALNTSGNVNLDSDTGVNDTGVVIKNYTSITINSGHTVTATYRSKAMLLYCTGNVQIDGTLTMTAKGAAAAISSDVAISKFIANALLPNEKAYQTFTAVQVGGAAGAANSGAGGTITNGTGGGGGGAGGAYGLSAGGTGAAGTAICGGSGGGAGNAVTGSNGAANGGQGGNAAAASGDRAMGGGAGNPVGTGSASGTGSVVAPTGGGGGLLIIIAGGTVTIGASGVVSANGGNGGNANGGASGTASFGGGGAGGGRIIILSAGAYTNSGTVQANGGAGGTAVNASNSPIAGGAGGAGTITQQVISA